MNSGPRGSAAAGKSDPKSPSAGAAADGAQVEAALSGSSSDLPLYECSAEMKHVLDKRGISVGDIIQSSRWWCMYYNASDQQPESAVKRRTAKGWRLSPLAALVAIVAAVREKPEMTVQQRIATLPNIVLFSNASRAKKSPLAFEQLAVMSAMHEFEVYAESKFGTDGVTALKEEEAAFPRREPVDYNDPKYGGKPPAGPPKAPKSLVLAAAAAAAAAGSSSVPLAKPAEGAAGAVAASPADGAVGGGGGRRGGRSRGVNAGATSAPATGPAGASAAASSPAGGGVTSAGAATGAATKRPRR